MKKLNITAIPYIFSQGMVTASSAIIVLFLSSEGDVSNVVKFGIYFSLLAILQSTLSLRYELGIYTDGGVNKKFALYTAIENSLLVSIIIAVGLTVLNYLGVNIWNFNFIEALLITITCCVGNISMVLKQYYIAKGQVKTVTRVNLISTIMLFLALLNAHLINSQKVFLIFLFVYFIMYSILIIHWLVSDNHKKYNQKDYRSQFIKGSDFIKFSTPGLLLNVLAQNVIILYFGVISDAVSLAQLVVIMRIVFLPLSLVSLPLSHLISTEVMNYMANEKGILIYLCQVIGVLLVLTLSYVAALLVLDAQWLKLVGIEEQYWESYVPILAILAFFRMTISPVSNILNVLKKEQVLFNLQLINALIIGALLFLGPQDIKHGLQIYVIGSVFFQVLCLWFILKASYGYDRSSNKRTFQ